MEIQTTTEFDSLLRESQELKSGLGAIVWAALEMLKQGGISKDRLDQVKEDMSTYFAKPNNDLCNAVLKVVETRLAQDKNNSGKWY